MYEEFKKLLIEQFEIDPSVITPDAKLTNDLGVNSLELAELFLQCEDKYNVEIDDDEIHKFVTVGDVVSYIEAAAN